MTATKRDGVYGRAARDYWRAGFTCPLPLPAGKKEHPPTGFTGKVGYGQDGRPTLVSIKDLARWELENSDGNIALRLIGRLVGIDVDAYDGKIGGEVFAEMERELGELPVTYTSSSRDDGVSGIRMFKLPEGVRVTKEAENRIVDRFGRDDSGRRISNIEIIREDHRYMVVWPSIHPDTGREYSWTLGSEPLAEGRVPELGKVAELPAAWIEFFCGPAGVSRTAGPRPLVVEQEDEFDSPATGERCYDAATVAGIIKEQLAGLGKAPRSRINATLNDAAFYLFHFAPAFIEERELALRLLKSQERAWLASGGADDHDYSAAQKTIRGARAAARKGWTATKEPADDEEDEGEGEQLEGRASVRTGAVGDDGRVKINTRQQAEAVDMLNETLGTGPTAGLFTRDGMLVRCPRIGETGYVPLTEEGKGSDGYAQVRPIDASGLRALFQVVYNVGVTSEKKQEDAAGETKVYVSWIRKIIPQSIAQLVASSAANGHCRALPTLRGVTHTPVIRKDGTVLDKPGFDEDSGLLFMPRDATVVPSVPLEPTKEQVAAAVEMLLHPISEFPFVTTGDRGNWIGTMLGLFLRPILPTEARRPMLIIDAPSPGSGKSLLANLMVIVHEGVIRSEIPTADQAEMSKLLASIFSSTTAPLAVFDNVTGTLRSSALEGAITSGELTDRVLGSTLMVRMVNDRQFVVTGNNAQIGGDLGRRTLWCTIDPKIPNPQTRKFSISPERWMHEHRGEYVSACLTLIRAWHCAGRPLPDSGRSDGFQLIVEMVRGVMSVAGISDVYGVGRHGEAQVSDDDSEWGEFLGALVDTFGMACKFSTKDVQSKMVIGEVPLERCPAVLAHDVERKGFPVSLSKWFRNRSGRWAGNLTLRSEKATSGPNKNLMLWWVSSDADLAGEADGHPLTESKTASSSENDLFDTDLG